MRNSARAASAVTLLTLASLAVNTSPAAAANACGGDVKDYTDVLTPFKGSVKINGVGKAMTLTPIQLDGLAMKTEIASDSGVRTATSVFWVYTDPLGHGQITFYTFNGYGDSESVTCAGAPGSTRVTAITGFADTTDGRFSFTVTRAAPTTRRTLGTNTHY